MPVAVELTNVKERNMDVALIKKPQPKDQTGKAAATTQSLAAALMV